MEGGKLAYGSHDDEYLSNTIEAQTRRLGKLGRRNGGVHVDSRVVNRESRTLQTCVLRVTDPRESRLGVAREDRLHGQARLIRCSSVLQALVTTMLLAGCPWG